MDDRVCDFDNQLVLDLLDRNDITVAAVKWRLWLPQVTKALDQVVNKLTI